ncbi:hypothetical protein [Paraglaciecola aestuariivivens]
MTFWTTHSLVAALISFMAVQLAAAVFICQTQQFKNIDAKSLLLHLNRKFKQCEESAELILQPDHCLTLMQRLQKQRIQANVESLLLSDLGPHLPYYSMRQPILLAAILLLILIGIEHRNTLFTSTLSPEKTTNQLTSKQTTTLRSAQVTIVPAPYTNLPKTQFLTLDIQLVAGAEVSWQLSFSELDTNLPLFLHINDLDPIPLTIQPDGSYLANSEITQSAVYYISQNQQMIGDIHTIEVAQDSRPSIRFISPVNTITEIPKNALPKVQSIVEIEDDFGLSKVEILASVASGSGEAVKFRDHTFEFDSQQQVEGKIHFIKNWGLSELGMQAGDELYFSVRAWDNRTPAPQQSRSPSKIIRWLEDQEQAVMVDGVLIDFMPEYFKSQRQIIIETQQLIADRTNLSQDLFDTKSRELGTAQSDLKQKYGQFLGDEFDSGTMHGMEQGLDSHPEAHSADEEDGKETHSAQASHEHQDEPEELSQDKSGYSQIIEQYGHAHGEADDGKFIKKGIPSPTLLMKRAIGNMWQAELFLHLSQPEKALPFENNALELINRAKKAERIYVKRLGFEPPPVSEKRRYQGDLSDILSYERNQQHSLPAPISADFKRLLNRLKQASSSPQSIELNDTDLAVIQKIKDYFTQSLEASPEYIKLIASLQKIQSTQSFTLKNCDKCIKELQQTLWRLLPAPIAMPVKQKKAYSLQNQILQNYQRLIQQHGQGAQP